MSKTKRIAGERESYRQRKIRLNKERRESLHNG